MKILMSAFAFEPGASSEPGAGWAFARAAAEHHDVWVITDGRRRTLIDEHRDRHPEQWRGIQVDYLDPPGSFAATLPEQVQYARWQRSLRRRAKALHAEIGFDLAHHVTIALDWLPTGLDRLDVPLVWGPVGGVPATPGPCWRWLGVHGALGEVARLAVTGTGRALVGRRTARRAAVVVGANEVAGRSLGEPPHLVVETNSAIDLGSLPERSGPVPGAPRALFVARLLPWKGGALAIDALARSDVASWTLTFLGDGPDEARLRRRAERRGVADRVEFRGSVPRAEVLDALATADALFLPTFHDAGPWAVAEAISIGCPVVALDWGGPGSLLAGGGGLAVPVTGRDLPGRLARALSSVEGTSQPRSTRFDRSRLADVVDGWYEDAVSTSTWPAARSADGPLRTDVLGVGISAIDPEQALEEITSWIDDGRRSYVCVTGVHGVMESQSDPELLRIHNESGLTTPDGMPMVWASRFAGHRHVRRVYGPDLMLAVCRRAAERGWSSYFYGGAEGVPDELAAALRTRFPGLKVVGAHSPPFRPLTDEEDAAIVDEINEAHPDLVWVGLSTPKQERWIAAHRDRLDAPVLLGVGAAFDFHTGRVSQAPAWMQRSGLEWLYRLGREPRRLWRRYLANNPRFLVAVLRRPPRRWEA